MPQDVACGYVGSLELLLISDTSSSMCFFYLKDPINAVNMWKYETTSTILTKIVDVGGQFVSLLHIGQITKRVQCLYRKPLSSYVAPVNIGINEPARFNP